jgi:hypothetical protein
MSKAHHVASRVEIDEKAGRDFPRLGSRRSLELNVERVGIGVVMELRDRSP